MERKQARQWLNVSCHRFLRKARVAEGQRVLDFGCGSGNYTIPAARIVGRRGTVYAVDKDSEALDRLMAKAKSEDLTNIRRVDVADNGGIPVRSHSVDGILLYDVLHGGYFPDENDRRKTLTELRRVLRRDGWLSFYPTHLKQYGLTLDRLRAELTRAGFAAADDGHRRTLIHDDNLVRGRVFSLRKATREVRASRRQSRRKAR